ncbi:MAG: amino acid ABC transporter substrate-binding protein [Halobacteriovoraceae bacterium]|nr:amino acid ABC transporter substrate-binding protein [Halobacteriovoraceae bacterium]
MKCKHLIFIFTVLINSVFADSILDKVKKRKMVHCGVTMGVAGFSSPNSKGEWFGIEVDVCRAVAAAVLGDAKKVKFIPLSGQARFTALQSGEVDLLSRVTTWTLTRDTALGLNFGPTVFYDGQGFMVRRKDKVKKIKDLNGATICTQQGTTSELNLADYFRANKIKMKPVVFENNDEVTQAFFKGRCDAFTNDASGLVAERSKTKNPDDYIILEEVISKEPLGPAVRHGDDQWFDIVKWSVFAMISAEEYGISSQNVDKVKKSSKVPNIKRLLGVTAGNGKSLGLSEDWAYNIIKLVGNYEEVFDKNIGSQSALKLERGLNALWKDGGLMYAPPIR